MKIKKGDVLAFCDECDDFIIHRHNICLECFVG